MLEEFLRANERLEGNPLGSHLQALATCLVEDGYAEETIRSKLKLLADFGRWLARTGLTVAHLEEGHVSAFVKQRQQVRRGDPRTLEQFLEHLRKHAVIPDREPVRDQSPLADILSRYEKHLRSERGLVTATVLNYQPFIRRFLVDRFGEGPFLFGQINSSDISNFVLRHGPGMSVGRAQLMTTAFRSFFRYLFQGGELQTDLAAAVPTVANWRLASVPKYLTSKQVKRVLKACNRHTAIGRRDYAILLLLARLGLRASEVVALQLEDINWRAGEIIVRGKGLFHDRMPLPPDVGQALSTYLRRDRSRCQSRRVFICVRAPHRGLSGASTLTTIVRRALARANLRLTFKGAAHLFRHSLATSMLHSGATMAEIGEVLRHRLPNTTEIYAKVDFEALRSLAHPWPIGGAQ
ncbi:MAG: tyrosine-type recombinase/integrase [Thiobacillaceae bacterium]